MSKTERTDSDKSEFRTSISLIARVRDRTDAEGWREFYQFYQPLLRRYMRSLGLEEHTANDVIQDVFVRLLQSLPTFELDGKRGRFRSYLWKLTYSALVDQARRVKARRQAEEEWVQRFQSANEAESLKVHHELNEINHQQVLARALPRVQSVTSSTAWTCFEQRLLRDRPGTVIAAELGISSKAVFVYASRVLKAVRKQCTAIAEELGDEPIDWLPRGT
ncbi:MAG: RNA polymerase sigma factor [Isosphaerales bacterium]